jgi:hypothetical protein
MVATESSPIMNSIVIGGIVFASAFGGALVGMFLKRALPESHLRPDSKEVIRLGTGLIATMAALVLGLLVGAAKTSFDVERSGFQQLALNVVLLDRTLAHYGPDTKQAREELRNSVTTVIDCLWPTDGSPSSGMADARITARSGALYDAVRGLSPADDSQRALQTQALQISADLARNRWQLGQRDDGSLPIPFLVVLAFWLFVLFTSFGLFSPPNVTVVAVLFICAMSVGGAVFLIVDLDQPFDGLVQISSVSLRDALANLGQ